MEETMQPQEAVRQKSTSILAAGIAASISLHLIAATLLVALPNGSSTNPPASYLDLRMLEAPAATAVPVQPAPEPVTPQPVATLPVSQNLVPTEFPTQQVPPQPVQQQQSRLPEPPVKQEARAMEPPHSTLGMGLTKGYFKSLGDGDTLREGVKGYYLEMLQGINEKWWVDQQLDKRRLDPLVVNLVIARNGDIVGSRVLRSSGNPRYDREVVAALNAAGPLPPLPKSYEGEYFEAPIRLVPPLNLLAW
jgi:periplasmic protein TonB